MDAIQFGVIATITNRVWAILEEYTTGNVLVQSYVQGYYDLVKTVQSNIYYYQDELGSTSHIASSTGQLLDSQSRCPASLDSRLRSEPPAVKLAPSQRLEYYKYDLYGKPTYFSSTSQPHMWATNS